jgi:hypothetical protein
MTESPQLLGTKNVLSHPRDGLLSGSGRSRRKRRRTLGDTSESRQILPSLGILGFSPYSPPDPPAIFAGESALLHPQDGCDLTPESEDLGVTSRPASPEQLGLSSYPSPAPSSSFQSPASSTDMDLEVLSTPASHLLEDLDFAIESDLLDDPECALDAPHSLFLDFHKGNPDERHDAPSSTTSHHFTSITYPYPLSPFHSPSPALHPILLPAFFPLPKAQPGVWT